MNRFAKYFTALTVVSAICIPQIAVANSYNGTNARVITVSGPNARLVTIEKGKPQTIRTNRPYVEVVVGDPEIATIQPLTDRSFYVIGKKSGTTGISLFDDNAQPVASIDLEVSVDTTRLKKSIRANVPDSNIKVSTSNGQVVLSGSAKDQVSADLAKKIATNFSGDDAEVINDVNITTSQQVQLNVRFVEINRNTGVGFGIESAGVDDDTEDKSSRGIGQVVELGGNLIGQLISGGVDIDVSLKALEDRGLARRLAEPNLIARSGESANFLAGGEYPIRVTDGDGGFTVEYKPFGVGLDFTPTVLKDGLISLEIAPEVSSIDNSGGFDFPVFLVRRARTAVDLRSGQSFMMAGMFQAENTVNTKGLPGLSKLPVIGALFSSKEFTRNETDLVMIVTPHLVKPISPTTPFATPIDGSRPATVAENTILQVDEMKTSSTGAEAGATLRGHFLSLEINE
ncbi:MAG: type II and III secretion system protein family protein [Pseudomonadota bacterium]